MRRLDYLWKEEKIRAMVLAGLLCPEEGLGDKYEIPKEGSKKDK
jgi:hypothetical protein